MTREFSEPTKQHIIEQQNNKCLNCGNEGHLSVHHQFPKSIGGGSQETNGVGLCRGKGTQECHTKADMLTIRFGIPFSRMAEEGIMPIMETLPRSMTVWERKPHKRRHGHQSRRRR
jgi:ferredoxin